MTKAEAIDVARSACEERRWSVKDPAQARVYWYPFSYLACWPNVKTRVRKRDAKILSFVCYAR